MRLKKSEAAYSEVTDIVQVKHGATVSKTFGTPTLKINGKVFAGLEKNEMIFKLTGEDHAKALKLKGAKLFDPMKNGKAMKEWVQVPAAHSKLWLKFAESALKYVKTKK
jgi:hypothetical protein